MKTNSLIVKDSGIHVSDGEVTVICQDQEQAAKLLLVKHCIFPKELKDIEGPYPIPNLRFTVKKRKSLPVKVAILSLEETKEKSQEEQKAISDELWNAGEIFNPTDFHLYIQKHFNVTRK